MMVSVGRETLVEQAQEILDKWEFFYGQRGGRELWAEKPKAVQDNDITKFCLDLNIVRSVICDTVPVVYGEWIDDTGCLDSVRQYKCSKCGKKPIINSNWVSVLTDFCPNCGADMRKKV